MTHIQTKNPAATKNVFDEVSFLYAKFDQAEREWLNRLTDLENHYNKAVKDFTASLPKKMTGKIGAGDVVDIASNVYIGGFGLSGGAAVVAIPVVMGLKKLASLVDVEIAPPTPDVMATKSRIDGIRQAFKDTTEHLGKQIVKLMEKAKNLGGGSAGAEISSAISQLLLSPVWYPPAINVTRNPGLAGAIEMRLWFQYFKQLMKLPVGYLVEGPYQSVDYSPMFDRMNEKGITANVDYIKIYTVQHKKGTWKPKGGQYDAIKALNNFGEKNRQLKIAHSYPMQVQNYLMGSKLHMVIDYARTAITGREPDESLLPPSTLTWADVSI